MKTVTGCEGGAVCSCVQVVHVPEMQWCRGWHDVLGYWPKAVWLEALDTCLVWCQSVKYWCILYRWGTYRKKFGKYTCSEGLFFHSQAWCYFVSLQRVTDGNAGCNDGTCLCVVCGVKANCEVWKQSKLVGETHDLFACVCVWHLWQMCQLDITARGAVRFVKPVWGLLMTCWLTWSYIVIYVKQLGDAYL
jgi:hypothetical protein